MLSQTRRQKRTKKALRETHCAMGTHPRAVASDPWPGSAGMEARWLTCAARGGLLHAKCQRKTTIEIHHGKKKSLQLTQSWT